MFKIGVADFFSSDTNLLLNIYADEVNLKCNYRPDSDIVADCFDSDGNLVSEYTPNDSSYELDTGIKILTSKQLLAAVKSGGYLNTFSPMSFAIYDNKVYVYFECRQCSPP